MLYRPQYQGGYGGNGGYPAGGNQTVIIQDGGRGSGYDNFGTGLLLGSALGFGLGNLFLV